MRELFDGLAPPAPRTRADDGGYSVALTEYEHRDFSLVDVMQAGCSKGSALRRVGGSVRASSPSEVMAVGDNLNDLEMLEFAGTPVVMGNAIDDAARRAAGRRPRPTTRRASRGRLRRSSSPRRPYVKMSTMTLGIVRTRE